MSVDELTEDEIDELRCALWFDDSDMGEDIRETFEWWTNIPTSVVYDHFAGIMFTEDDFFCNQ